MGFAALAQANYDLARSNYESRSPPGSGNVDELTELGFVLFDCDTLEAEVALRSAIAINDKYFYANYDLGRSLKNGRS